MSPQPEKSSDLISLTNSQMEFSLEERRLLLRLAHDAIAAEFQPRELPFEPPSPHLAEMRGAFTTLYSRGQLRGCVGYVLPVAPLYRTVMETARAAAFDDTRFGPVVESEVPELEVSLSVLSPLEPIRAEDVAIGRHGLLVTVGTHRGLLLPQVPLEHGWDRVTFLEQTCRKAGLPMNAWQQAKLEAFTAEIFGDRDLTA